MIRDADTERFINACIGPRIVAGRYFDHYWGDEYTVLAIDRNPPNHMLWSITEATDTELAAGTSRTHCTAWDERDRVISQPQKVA
jgi:hypothetical protein